MCKNILIVDLLGSQHLFEVLQTSLTLINSEYVVKSRYFKKRFAIKSANFSSKGRKDKRVLA